jgi:glutathione S-transferase
MLKIHLSYISPYSQKVLMALLEKGLEFEPIITNILDPAGRERFQAISPLGRLPYLIDEERGQRFAESSIIIDYLDEISPEKPMIPRDPRKARLARYYDRMGDQYLLDQVGIFFFDGKRAECSYPEVKAKAMRTFTEGMTQLSRDLGDREFIVPGEGLTLGDLSATLALGFVLHAKMLDISAWPNLIAWTQRVLSRPSAQTIYQRAAAQMAGQL